MTHTGVRRDILLAAEQLILGSGIQAATTRAIAKAAGCSEGSIYRHFDGKNALVLEVVKACFADFVQSLDELAGRAGKGSVYGNLREVAGKALTFYRATLPVASGVLSDHSLLEDHRLYFKSGKVGPLHAVSAVAAYLEQERARGRVSTEVAPDHAARMLLGTLLAQAFLEELTGEPGPGTGGDEELVDGLLSTLWRALRPGEQMAARSA